MRTSWCWSLLFTVLVAPEAVAQGRRRFSAEAITLLEQLTQAYDLNGKRMPAGKFDESVLARLAKSEDAQISYVALMSHELKLLSALNKQQGRVLAKGFGDQAKELPKKMAERLIEMLYNSDEEKEDIRSAAKTLEAIMGTEPQEKVNKAWAIAYMGNRLGNILKGQLQKLAARGSAGEPVNQNDIDVTLGTEPAQLGTVTITNRTMRTFHHCLLITRLIADGERMRRLAAQEDAFGKFILPGLGFSKETVEGSRQAARLRYRFHQQDKGVVVYVAEIPPGGRVTTTLATPSYYTIAKGAEVSFWSDETAIESRQASNWEKARLAVEEMRRPVSKKIGNTAATDSTDLFAVGSVWRGTLTGGVKGAKARVTHRIEITITERDGDKYKASYRVIGKQRNNIEGTVTDSDIKWEFVINGKTGNPVSGTVKGKHMEVTISSTNGGATVIEGKMTLDYVSAGKR